MNLQEQITETLESLEKLITPQGEDIGLYAKHKANEKYLEKKLKAIIAIEKKKHSGSDANRSMEAEASTAYSDALWRLAEAQGLAYQSSAEKDLLEARLDSLRSLLSFEKDQINRLT